MTPREFLMQVAEPNIADFHTNFADIRHAYNAVASVDALAAHVYDWCGTHAPAELKGAQDDTYFRALLAQRNDHFALLRDIAKAQKHVRLERGNPRIKLASQISSRPIRWGEGDYGAGRYGGPPQVVVDIAPGDFQYVETVVDGARAFLEGEMQRLGI